MEAGDTAIFGDLCDHGSMQSELHLTKEAFDSKPLVAAVGILRNVNTIEVGIIYNKPTYIDQ